MKYFQSPTWNKPPACELEQTKQTKDEQKNTDNNYNKSTDNFRGNSDKT